MENNIFNSFQQEEVRILYSMVDGVANNPNQYALEINLKGHPRFREGPSALMFIVDLICLEGERLDLLNFIQRTSLEDMPMHINDLDPYGLIARWRLKIGK